VNELPSFRRQPQKAKTKRVKRTRKKRRTKKGANAVKPPKGGFTLDEDLWFGALATDDFEIKAAESMVAKAAMVYGTKPFPQAAQELLSLTRKSTASVDDAVSILETDAALSASLLRLVNSAAYALAVPCKSVQHAAAILGNGPLNWLAMTASVAQMFDVQQVVAAELLEHDGDVAAVCRYLAPLCGLPAQEMFTCGFMHDIGKLMFLDNDDGEYVQMLAEAGSSGNRMHELELDRFGFDHAVLAAHVLKAWAIPDPVPKVVALHHQPARAATTSPRTAAMVALVRLADTICWRIHDDTDGTLVQELAQTEMTQRLSLSEPQLAAVWRDIQVLTGCDVDDDDTPMSDSAGAAGPVPSIRPKSIRSRHPKSEQAARLVAPQVDCEVCGAASFGNACALCGKVTCAKCRKQRWCEPCGTAFRRAERALKEDTPLHVTTGAGVGLFMGLAAWWSFGIALGGWWLIPAFVAFVSPLWLAVARSLSRSSFFRSRSGRTYFRRGWWRAFRWRVRIADLLPDQDD